jgi:hypothetical protein
MKKITHLGKDKDRGVEVLQVWNLTRKTMDFGEPSKLGLRARKEAALVEAMMVINWLSKLRTSRSL